MSMQKGLKFGEKGPDENAEKRVDMTSKSASCCTSEHIYVNYSLHSMANEVAKQQLL